MRICTSSLQLAGHHLHMTAASANTVIFASDLPSHLQHVSYMYDYKTTQQLTYNSSNR